MEPSNISKSKKISLSGKPGKQLINQVNNKVN